MLPHFLFFYFDILDIDIPACASAAQPSRRDRFSITRLQSRLPALLMPAAAARAVDIADIRQRSSFTSVDIDFALRLPSSAMRATYGRFRLSPPPRQHRPCRHAHTRSRFSASPLPSARSWQKHPRRHEIAIVGGRWRCTRAFVSRLAKTLISL